MPRQRSNATNDASRGGGAEKESWSHAFLELSHDLMCLCDNGQIQYINENGAKLLGLKTRDVAMGRAFQDFIHQDYCDLTINLLSYLAEKKEILPLKLAGRDGIDRDVEIRVAHLDPEFPTRLLIYGRDLTRQVAAAEQQRRREQVLRDALDAIPEAVLIVNARGEIESCNGSGERVFDVPRMDVIGRHVDQLFTTTQNKGSAFQTVSSADRRRIMDRVSSLSVVRGKNAPSVPVDVTITEFRRGADTLYTWIVHPYLDTDPQDGMTFGHTAHERCVQCDQLRLAVQIFENLEEAIVIADADFRVTSVNPAFTRMTGFDSSEIVGSLPPFINAVSEEGSLYADLWKAIAAHAYWEGEVWNARKDGTKYAEYIQLSAMRDASGVIMEYAAVINDITQQKRDQERIRYQENFDGLTGLPNRTLFLERIASAISGARRDDSPVALLFMDLDGFKLVNDTYGHEIGDHLLQEAARRLTKCVRVGDTVARMGGDEFTVIMPHIHENQDASTLATRMLEELSAPFKLEDQETYISASIGIAMFPANGKDVGELLKNADAAMYQAKERGKANYQFYTAELNAQVHERLTLKNGLTRALDRGELALHYQPKLNLDGGYVTGVEALMRWSSPELGFVSPVRFIPVMEETGMVVEVGAWALREACRQHKRWVEQGLGVLPIAVNLSPRQIQEKNFVEMFRSILDETGVSSDGIEIEITESMLMSDVEHSIKALWAIHDMGIHVSMDDFGTGYSSLSYLKKFPIDTIKIDKSFVQDIATDLDDAEIIKTIIGMGHTLHRRIVAEGVEDARQLEILKEYRCDEIQGYFFSRPLPSEDATRFLLDHKRP